MFSWLDIKVDVFQNWVKVLVISNIDSLEGDASLGGPALHGSQIWEGKKLILSGFKWNQFRGKMGISQTVPIRWLSWNGGVMCDPLDRIEEHFCFRDTPHGPVKEGADLRGEGVGGVRSNRSWHTGGSQTHHNGVSNSEANNTRGNSAMEASCDAAHAGSQHYAAAQVVLIKYSAQNMNIQRKKSLLDEYGWNHFIWSEHHDSRHFLEIWVVQNFKSLENIYHMILE